MIGLYYTKRLPDCVKKENFFWDCLTFILPHMFDVNMNVNASKHQVFCE